MNLPPERRTLVERLWESDAASALTNEAAREIESLQTACAAAQAENAGLRAKLQQQIDDEAELLTIAHLNGAHSANDAVRALKARVGALESEVATLRLIVSRCASALGTNAFCSPDASIEFMAKVPDEVGLSIRRERTLNKALEVGYADQKAAFEAAREAAELAISRNKALEAVIRMPGKQQRVWWLSELFRAKGHFTRGDLCRHFGISVPQATTDIQRWMDLNTGAAIYNASAKRFEASKKEQRGT